jgi:hypothetical protein
MKNRREYFSHATVRERESSKLMKATILTTVIAALAMISASPIADARPHHRGKHGSHVYVSGYRSCGTPIYTERYIKRYKRCGAPVWGYRVVGPPRRYYVAPQPYYRPACPPPAYYPPPVCPPPYPHHGSGVVIQGTFRL